MHIKSASLRSLFQAFMAEQNPHLCGHLQEIWPEHLAAEFPALAELDFAALINKNIANLFPVLELMPELSPFVNASERQKHELAKIVAGVNGFFYRAQVKKSLSSAEKLRILKGMYLTRAVDSTLKRLFMSGDIKYQNKAFQGKGFRSLMQEAIYAASIRLHHGAHFFQEGKWQGDVVAPLIRDLGLALAFTDDDIEMVINAQAGKDGAPSFGKDLHYGASERGVLFAAAPLAIATCNAAGAAFAFKLKNEQRVALSFIGDGGSSLGEWHEAINFAAVNKLPMIFCVENNQTALSTPVTQQSNARLFADKAVGYGMMHLSLDGTDPEAIAAAFAWGAQRAREGLGPVLLELISMRMCGHAHHDDMLYLGHDPAFSFELPVPSTGGYIDKAKYQHWAHRDPLKSYGEQLIEEKVCTTDDIESLKKELLQRCERAVEAIKARPWPEPSQKSVAVFSPSEKISFSPGARESVIEPAPAFSAQGITYLEAIWRALAEVLRSNPNCYLLGEDVGAPYGNAFMVLKPLLKEFESRIFNTPIAENAIIGACVGMALEGLRPIGEMQFNDFVASGFNQLVNNAAKMYYRTGQKVPMVLRMPWGGLRRAGPYHSQDTSPWFYRSFGLKIVAPSTPHDAIGLMLAAVADENPVLYYEHIGLYRAVDIKQELASSLQPIEIGKAALRRLGSHISIISYGAYVHRAFNCAEKVAKEEGIECEVLDLRTLCPLDIEAISATVKRTGKVLLVGEDSGTGSILESIAAKIGASLFSFLDGPVKVLGSLDTPVPYSPPLEDHFLLSDDTIIKEIKDLHAW